MMKTRAEFRSRIARWSLMLVLGSFAAHQAAAGYVIIQGNRKVEGKVSVRANGTVVVETAVGRQEFPKAQVLQAVGDKPAEFDAAVARLQARDYKQAIPLLAKIATEQRGLGWDQKAMRYMGQAQLLDGDAAGAVRTYEKLLAADGKPEDDVLLGYCQALLATKAYTKLDEQIEQVVARGPRSLAAEAHLLRGDAKAARDLWEDAVLDYMRIVLVYGDQDGPQPEAVFKTAEALAALGDSRAREYYERVIKDYPDSKYAAEAKAKL